MFNKKLLYILFIIFISILNIIVVTYLSRNCIIWDDDAWIGTYSYGSSVFDSLFGERAAQQHGGRYIGIFLTQFFCTKFPLIVGMHTNDFACFGNGIIKGIFLNITILSIASFSIFFKKSKFIYLLSFIVLSCLCYYYYFICESYVLIVNYNFYRYLVTLMIFSIFIHRLCSIIFEIKEKHSILKVILLCVCAFELGLSSEITILTALLFTLLIVFYNLLIKLSTFVNKKINFDSLKMNTNKYFILYSLSLYTGIFLFIINPGFIKVALERIVENPMLKINEFIYYFKLLFFNKELVYWIIFIAMFIIALYFAVKKKRNKTSNNPSIFIN